MTDADTSDRLLRTFLTAIISYANLQYLLDYKNPLWTLLKLILFFIFPLLPVVESIANLRLAKSYLDEAHSIYLYVDGKRLNSPVKTCKNVWFLLSKAIGQRCDVVEGERGQHVGLGSPSVSEYEVLNNHLSGTGLLTQGILLALATAQLLRAVGGELLHLVMGSDTFAPADAKVLWFGAAGLVVLVRSWIALRANNRWSTLVRRKDGEPTTDSQMAKLRLLSETIALDMSGILILSTVILIVDRTWPGTMWGHMGAFHHP